MRRWTIVTFGLLALAYLATGWMTVPPGEAVVVRRFGRVLPRPWTQGPHLSLPYGLDQRDRVRTDEVRRLEIGLAGTPGPDDSPGAGEFLTGDLNILRARAVVQYRVADPIAFVLHPADPEALLHRLAEASMAAALSHRSIDNALRASRVEIAADAQNLLARETVRYDLGLAILGVSLTDVAPPSEVQPDFDAAQAAQSEHARRLNEAKSYEAVTLPAARAKALAQTEAAQAQANRTISQARSQAERFVALLAEADRSRSLTVRRLYFDAVKELLPRVKRKVLMTPDEPVDLGILEGSSVK